MVCMARKKKSTDRHDPTKLQVTIRLRADLGGQLKAFVAYSATDLNSEIRTAIRERLERNGFWPPPTQSDD